MAVQGPRGLGPSPGTGWPSDLSVCRAGIWTGKNECQTQILQGPDLSPRVGPGPLHVLTGSWWSRRTLRLAYGGGERLTKGNVTLPQQPAWDLRVSETEEGASLGLHILLR